MPTNFTGVQLLRDVLRDHSTLQMSKGQQAFEMREADVSVFRMFFEMAGRTLSPGDLAALQNTRNSSQQVTLFLWNKIAEGTQNSRLRQGTGGASPVVVTPNYFDPIVEMFDVSFVNASLRQYGSEGADKAEITRRAYTDLVGHLMAQKIKNIYKRAETQYINFLEAQKWALNTLADAGTNYTTFLGDAKRVPNTEALQFLQKMQVEAEQNLFAEMGTPKLVHSTTGLNNINDYLARGTANDQNVAQFLNWFDPVMGKRITNGAGVASTFYLVSEGGLAGYQRAFPWDSHPDAVNGEVVAGNDSWSMLEVGGSDTMDIFSNVPGLRLEVKGYDGYADNSASFAIDESNIDIVKNVALTVQFGGIQAYAQDPSEKPIVKYEYLS